MQKKQLSSALISDLAFGLSEQDHVARGEQNLAAYLASNEGLSSSSSSLPPLDQFTACSDDSSIISALSYDEDDQESSPPRSIFAKYWKKNQGEVKNARVTGKQSTPRIPTVETTSLEESSVISYERSLMVNEGVQCVSPVTRRRIFEKKCLSESSPTLTLISLASLSHDKAVRKAKSASTLLEQRPRASCLRPSRFSGGKRLDFDSSSSFASVSFSDRVDTIVFEKPVENWAANGWSAWFS